MGLFRRKLLMYWLRNWLKKKINGKRKNKLKKRKNKLKKLVISETYDINHPLQCRKKFKSIVLNNGLNALLISDEVLTSSAAAVIVEFGSFNDPIDMQGIAHLMEHMFFNGSTNLEENEFYDFVHRNGGDTFAITEMEHMCFSFAVNNDQFDIALEMFANMFNEPLMDIEILKNEMKILNQEFELHKYEDSSRMEQLFSHTSLKGHPFNRFTWGNNQSFSGKDPQVLRDCAMKLFRKHFVGASMKLVVISSEDVNKLEDSVVEFFSKVKRGQKTNFVFPKFEDPLWKYGVSYTLESLEEAQRMKITWLLPPKSLSHVESRPEDLICRLLSEESEGTICYFFKSKHWITSFIVSLGHEFEFSDVGTCSFASTAGGQLFMIDLNMTDTGLEHKYEMVSYIYQYLHLLRTCENSMLLTSLIEDYKFSLEMKYNCLEHDINQLSNPLDFSLALAGNMLSFPVLHAFSLDYCYQFGDFEAIQKMVGNFTPHNMRIDILSLSPIEEEQKVPYFSFKFKEEQILPHYMEKWGTFEDLHVDPALHLPQPNCFMPKLSFWRDEEGTCEEDIEILDSDDDIDSDRMEFDDDDDEERSIQMNDDVLDSDDDIDFDPMEFDDDDDDEERSIQMKDDVPGSDDDMYEEIDEKSTFQTTVIDPYNKFFWRDEDGMLSNATFKIYVNVGQDLNSLMIFRVYFEMVQAELSSIIDLGGDAYINCKLSLGDDKCIELILDGYNGKFEDFLSNIWKRFRSFVPTSRAVETIIKMMKRQFHLGSRNIGEHAKQILSESLIQGQFSLDDKFGALEFITVEDLVAFSHKMQQIRILGVFSGKFSEHDCRRMLDLFKPYGKFKIPRIFVTKKELSLDSPFRVSIKPKVGMESNSLAMVYHQMSCEEDSEFNSVKVLAFLHLLCAMVDGKMYRELRLKERLGYELGCDVHNLKGTLGFYLYVVSSDHKYKDLLEKMYAFIDTIPDHLSTVDDKLFQQYKNGVVLPDSGISPHIDDDRHCGSGHPTVAERLLENMEKEDMIKLYDRLFVKKRYILEVCIGSDS